MARRLAANLIGRCYNDGLAGPALNIEKRFEYVLRERRLWT